jgi:hypothetical protein
MKGIQLLVVTAVIVTLCVFAKSAIADGPIVLCKINGEVCKAENYAGETFTSTSEVSFGFGELGTIKCFSTMSRNESGQISTLSFTGCSESCVVKANGLPYASLVNPTGGNGKIEFSGGSTPKLAVSCGSNECVYGLGAIELEFTGGAPANIIVSKSLTRQTGSFFCPSAAKWEGNYKFTSPSSAVYMAYMAFEGPKFCQLNETICPQKSVINFVEFELQPEATFTVNKLVGGTVSCSLSNFWLSLPYTKSHWGYEQSWFYECAHSTYTGCEVEWYFWPYSFSSKALGGGNGKIFATILVPKEEGLMLVSCLSKGIPFDCWYEAEELWFEFEGGEPGTAQETGSMARLEGKSEFCPENVSTKGSYETVSPTEVYLTET